MARTPDHPGSLDRLPSGTWRLRFSIDGERHRETIDEDLSHADAAKYARNRYDELAGRAERRKLGLPTETRFSDLRKSYEEDVLPGLTEGTRRTYRDCLKPLKYFFEEVRDDPKLAEIRTAHVNRYMEWRRTHSPDGTEREDPLSAATVNKDRRVLRRLFEMAERWDLRDGNPASNTDALPEDGREPLILSDSQYEELIKKAEARDSMLGAYVTLLGETGARAKSEALWLQWQDVDLEDGFVHIVTGRDGHRTKSGRSRYTPLTPRLRERLRDHAAEYRMQTYDGERSPWLFHHTLKNIPNVDPGGRRRDYREAFTKAAEDAGLPDRFIRHDLRHRRATTWLAEGRSPVKVKEALGHADISTTLKYTHLVKDHLRSLVEEQDQEERLLRVLKLLLSDEDGPSKDDVRGLLK